MPDSADFEGRDPSAGAASQGGAAGSGDPHRADPHGGASYGGGARGDRAFGSDGFGAAGPRLFDDLARLVTDAAGAAQGVRREVETVARAQMESVLSRMDVVRRDEFEAVREMAQRARAEADALRAELAELRARVDGTGG